MLLKTENSTVSLGNLFLLFLVFPIRSFILSLELNFFFQFLSPYFFPTHTQCGEQLPHFLFSVTFAHQILITLYIFFKLNNPNVSNVLCKYCLSDLLLFFIAFSFISLVWTTLETRDRSGWGLTCSGRGRLLTPPSVLFAFWELTISVFWFTSENAFF